jgi:tellurite resistance protein
MVTEQGLLSRVAAAIAAAASELDEPEAPSLVSVTSEAYALHPGADRPAPEDFDAEAAAFFEALVESVYLVANADGIFDETEQRAFREVMSAALGGRVAEPQLAALLADLHASLVEDGIDRRVAVVARCVSDRERAREVLRVSALMAAVSGGVGAEERTVLARLAAGFALPEPEIDRAVAAARRAIGVPPPAELD